MTGFDLSPSDDADLTLTRTFNASTALVWRALTDPALLTRWQSNDLRPMVTCTIDLRAGGVFDRVWRLGPDRTIACRGEILSVDPDRRLVHTELPQDGTSGRVIVTQTLATTAPQTTSLTLHLRYTDPVARQTALDIGLASKLDLTFRNLDRLLPSLVPGRSDFRLVASDERHITVTRSFAAPRAAVYRAHTEAALLRRWMGSPEMPLDICEIDARPGGTFRYVWVMQDGTRITLTGTFTTLAPDRITHTEVFDPDWTGGPTEVETTFTEAAGRTTVTVRIAYSGIPARDMVLASGMGEGMAGSFDLLDALLAEEPNPA